MLTCGRNFLYGVGLNSSLTNDTLDRLLSAFDTGRIKINGSIFCPDMISLSAAIIAGELKVGFGAVLFSVIAGVGNGISGIKLANRHLPAVANGKIPVCNGKLCGVALCFYCSVTVTVEGYDLVCSTRVRRTGNRITVFINLVYGVEE